MFRKFWSTEVAKLISSFGKKKIFFGLGVFDGVHMGHQKIISELKSMAKDDGIVVAVTFSPHPRTLLKFGNDVKLLISLEQRIELLKSYGVDEVIVVDFTQEVANLSAEEFLDTIYEACEGTLAGICVGKHWHFGAGGKGNTTLLGEFTAKHQINFVGVEEIQLFGEVVSSSNIRHLLAQAKLDMVNQLLGRKYRVRGVVEKGYSNASNKLEKPTANLKLENELLIKDGVYAAQCFLNGKSYNAAVNIGVSPSFNYSNAKRRIEVHLLDFSKDIYGEELELEVIKYLREERLFSSIDELKEQISKDVKEISELFKDKEI